MRWRGGGLAAMVILALAAPGMAQKGEGRLDAPAVAPLGVAGLGQDGSAALGIGLRLFGMADAPAAEAPPQQPAPQAAAPPPAAPQQAAPQQPAPQQAAPQQVSPVAPSRNKPDIAGVPVPTAPGQGGRPAGTPPAARTAFQPSAAVSQRVRQQIIAATPNLTPQLRQMIQAGTPWVEFDRLLRRHGYSSSDLADVVAAFYLLAWEVATGGDALTQPAGIAAVRRQMRSLMAGLPAVAAMDDAQRQSTAELLSFYSMVIAARANELRQQGAAGQAALAQLREQVATQVRQQGVDLRRFSLTPAGFRAR